MNRQKSMLEDSFYSRDFNIITNQLTSNHTLATKQPLLPHIQGKKHANSTISCGIDRSRNRTYNASGYDFNILNQRQNNRSLMVRYRDENMGDTVQSPNTRKIYHLTRYREQADISGMRYRKDYEQASKGKKFNRKKGWIKDYIGNQVNTINHCLKRF